MIDALSRLAPPLGAARSTGAMTGTLGTAQQGVAPAAAAPSFSEVFEQVSRDAVQSLKGAEATSIAALQDRASALEVAEAIKSAEQALQTATAIRDKIVQSYQEISRMAI